MNDQWTKKFLSVMSRDNHGQEQEFLSLIDALKGECTLDTARVLMKSFNSKPDYGTQESVVSAIAASTKSDAITAVLEEMPRLLLEAPEWAHIMLGQEIDRRPDMVHSIAMALKDSEQRVAFNHLLNDVEFQNFYPNAKVIKAI
jgi:hypothetical protein